MPSINGEIISSRIDRKEAETFKSIARKNGTTASMLIARLIRAVNDGQIEIQGGMLKVHDGYLTEPQIKVLNEACRKTHSGSVTEFLSGIVSQIERQL